LAVLLSALPDHDLFPDQTHAGVGALMRRKRGLARRMVLSGGLLFFGLWTVLPMYWIVVTAIKPNLLIYLEPSIFPTQITGEQFAFVLTKTPFLLDVKNMRLLALLTNG